MSLSNYYTKKLNDRYGGGISSNEDFTKWLDDTQKTIKGYVDYANSTSGKWDKNYGADYEATIADLKSKAKGIKYYAASHAGDFKDYEGVKKAIDEYTKALDSASGNISSLRKFYSQFDNAESFNAWNEKETFINEWLKDPESATQNSKYQSSWVNEAKIRKIVSDAKSDKDFIGYSKLGAQAAVPNWRDVNFGNVMPRNMVTYAESLYQGQLYRPDRAGERFGYLSKLIHKHMKPEEKEIYNYLIGKNDRMGAAFYLSQLEDVLRQREGIEKGQKANETWYGELALAFEAGLESFVTGIENLVNSFTGEEGAGTSATQYAFAEASKDNEGAWKVVTDLANTAGNMLPSIAVGMVTGGLGGAATMGASASGNAYAEMRANGYDEWQSRGYGLLVGLSEASLQYVLGGISPLGKANGSVLSKATTAALKKVDNGLARFAIKLGSNMLEEGFEEAAQSVLEPIFKSIFTGEDLDIDWGEVVYSGLLGALSGGMFEGGGALISAPSTIERNAAAKETYGSNQQGLVSKALEIDPNNARAQRMQSKLDKGENLSGYQLNLLASEANSAIREKNTSALTSALMEKGIGKKKANKIAKYILDDPSLSNRVSNKIENNESLQSVIDDVLTNVNINWADIDAELAYDPQSVSSAPQHQNVVNDSAGEEKEASDKVTIKKDGEEVEVKPLRIASLENGKMTIELEGGTVVSAGEVDFGDGVGLVYQAASEMASRVGGFNIDTANLFVQGFDPKSGLTAAEYVHGFTDAYRFGAKGFPVSELESGTFTSKLTNEQRTRAYNLGKAFGNENVANKQAKIVNTVTKNVENNSKSPSKVKKGKLHFDGSVVGKNLTERQKASLKGLRTVAEAMGIDIYIFESEVVDGKRQGANGWYDPSDNSIHLDLYAGVKGDSLILFTAAHELTHHIREMSPVKFKVFADALLEEYSKNGHSIEKLIENKKADLRKNGRIEGLTEEQAYDLAYEEVVADAAETMLVDSNALEALSKKLHAKDKGLWQTIKDFIAKLVARIKAAYKGLNPDSAEANYVRDMVDSAERLQKLWVDALLDASEVSLGESGIIVDSKTDSASLMSVRDILSHEDRQKVSKALAARFGVTQSEAMDWLKAETSLASLILNPKYSQYLDYTADPNEEAIKSNSDYPQGTVDFSNICKKRRDFTEVMNRVLRNFPNHVFAATDLAKIRTIMEQEGMEVACAICYVEDRRQLDSVVAQDFIDSIELYRKGSKTRPDGNPFNANQLKAFKLIEGDTYTPSIYELISLEGRNSLKVKNPAMEEAWVKFNNARGMQSVRLLLNDAEYKRQILKYTHSVVKRKNDYGGLRIYSFSDAEMFHLIDIIQVLTDSATVGLSVQGYTKVNEYAKAVKDTGEKLNRSLIPKGELGYHMEGGRVVLDFDTVEGIDINHPDFFDNIDNPNIGNIVIGINATQIKAAMTSKFIDQIIPFHTGQSNEVLGEKGIATWENYKDSQSERDAKTNKKSSHQINIYTEVINAAEAEGNPITNKVDFVNKFLEVCKVNGLIPRFSEFLNVNENGDYVYTEGYHKFLVDFKTFDQNTGEYLPQMPVKPIFDNEYITKLLTDYVDSQKVKDAELSKAMPRVLDRITKEIVKPSDDVKYSNRVATDEKQFNPEGKTFDEQLEDILNSAESFDGRYLYIGRFTSDFVEMVKPYVEMKDLPIAMNYRDAYLSMESADNGKYKGNGINYHNLGKEGLKSAIESFGSPEQVLLSKKDGKVELVLQGVDKNGNKLLSIVALNTNAKNAKKYIEAHIVTSIYGRRSIEKYIDAAEKEGRLIYNKREESTQVNPQVQYEGIVNANSSVDSIPQSPNSVKGKIKNSDRASQKASYSDIDSTYLDAVNRGDMETAQRMVDEAAKKAGYTVKGLHATNAEFTVFDINKTSSENFHGKGIYFTNSVRDVENNYENYEGPDPWQKIEGRAYELVYDKYGISYEDTLTSDSEIIDKLNECYDIAIDEFKKSGRRITAYLRFDNPLILEKGMQIPNNYAGYDGIVDKQVYENIGHSGMDEKTIHYVVFNPNNIKSADPVTYDDNGNVIPLSERFNPKNSDIRYQDRNPDSFSNRSLLANALEGVAQNDIERNKLQQYKEKIELLNAEQAKLRDLREQIKKLSFAKGPRDTQAIKSLQLEANQAANRINTYDRQLLSLESTKALKGVLEREKKLAYQKAEKKGKEALAKYREKAADTQRELMTRYQEARKRGIESRNKTAMRHRIISVVGDLNKLLLHESKERNIKEGLKSAVALALEAVNLDTVSADARIAKLEEELLKAGAAQNLDKVAEIQHKIDYVRKLGDSMKDKLTALKSAYEEIASSADSSNQFKEEAALINTKVQSTIEKVGDTPLRDMTLSQLEAVHDLYKMVLTTVRDANKLWRQGKQEDLQQYAKSIEDEIAKFGKSPAEVTAIREWFRKFKWNEMIPYYFFENIGSETLAKLFYDFIEAQNTYAVDLDEAKLFAAKTRAKHGYEKWKLDKVYSFKLNDGRTFETTLKHLLSIYAYSKRDQALEHMSVGGFFHNDKATFRKKGGVFELVRTDTEGYRVDAKTLVEIQNALTDEQKAYVEEMQDYLTKMGEKGNEVTRVLWGIDLFKEKVYFPLKSKDDFLKKSNETAQAVALKNDGMTKEVKPGASNPIVLEAFDDVWASHINRMSQYHAFVLPIDNMNKVSQYGTWANNEASSTVSTKIKGIYGTAATDYLQQFIKDMNGNVVAQGVTNPIAGMFNKFKKTAVAASLSVIIQQPTAIARAISEIDPRYFVGNPKFSWDEIRKYAPIAIIKDIGGFDAGSGVRAEKWLNNGAETGISKVTSAIDEYAMKGAEMADRLGWGNIWNAVKRETAHNNPTLKTNSEEFLKLCGKRFTEVIVKTQVYDSTLSRSAFMRSKHDIVKMLTSFMGEPTVAMNMLYNGVVTVLRGKSKAAIAKGARMIAAVYLASVLGAAFKSLISALNDDDEDESYWEKYMQALGNNTLGEVVLLPASSLPIFRDVVSIIQGYDVERGDLSVFKDVYDAFSSLSSDSKGTYKKVEDFAGSIAALFGIPAKNLLRTGRQIYNLGKTIFDDISGGNLGKSFVEGFTNEKRGVSEKIYDAILDGDDARLDVLLEGKSRSEIASAYRQALRENDPRIKAAAIVKADGNFEKYESIALQIELEGYFEKEDIKAAITSEFNELTKVDAPSNESVDKDEAVSWYNTADIHVAFEKGDNAFAKEIIADIINTKVANGKTEKEAKTSIRRSMTSYWKPLYIAAHDSKNYEEKARIKKILIDSGFYGDKYAVDEILADWLKN